MVTDQIETSTARATRRALFGAALLCGVALLGCESRTDKVDGGGVLLSVSNFDGLPIQVSMDQAAAAGLVTIGQLTIENIVKDPSGATSDLMNVEIESVEVTFSRADTGTRLPPPLVHDLFGVVPANGTFVIDNLAILTLQQLGAPPLSDLLTINGGVDTETGGRTILLNFAMRFFGRTLSGDAVDTAPARFTIEFTR